MGLSGPTTLIRFGTFELDAAAGELRKAGITLKLHPQPFQVLVLLTQHHGEIVTREQIRAQLWGQNTFVDFERGITVCITQVRNTLGDNSEKPRYVETLARRGYRFIAPVSLGAAHTAPFVAERISERPTDHDLPTIVAPHGQADTRLQSLAAARTTKGKYSLAALGLVVVAAAALAWQWHSRQNATPIRSLAVLPLENLSGDPAQDYFADGMTEELITDLGQISSLRVISRTSVNHYKGTKKPLPEIARELGVDVLVEGTFTRLGNHVRITTNLVQAMPERHLWAESYDRELSDILKLQSEVTQAIANHIKAELTPSEQTRLAKRPTTSVEAQQFYLKGRYFWNKRTQEGLEKSLEYFQQAVEKDSNYALAYAGMADSYTILAAGEYAVLSPGEAVPKAKMAANKALQLDNALAEAHASLGFLKHSFDWDWRGAEDEYKQAIELNPSYATAHHWYAIYLVEMGRFTEATAEIKKSESLDPLSLIISSDFGWILYNERQYDSAIQQLRKTIELDPNFASGHWTLGLAYGGKGMSKEAVAELQKAVDLSGGLPVCVAALGRAFAQAGDREQALRIVNDLQDQAKHRYVLPDGLAYIYTALGDNDQAMARLERAYAERTDAMPLLKVDPRLDPLRSDPRFVALLRRVDFPP
jgi:TolB-like protein/DNA-binding winged helix-turn-helix (wHTH) protein/Tfp pilus assembly protein PilF